MAKGSAAATEGSNLSLGRWDCRISAFKVGAESFTDEFRARARFSFSHFFELPHERGRQGNCHCLCGSHSFLKYDLIILVLILCRRAILVKGAQGSPSDSAKCHLPIGYAADLTPVVAAREAGASWNAGGRAERVWELSCAVDFLGRKEYGGRGVRAYARKDCRTRRRTRPGEVNWYWAKEPRTNRPSAWRTHERSRIFGEHGCGLGAGRRPGTGYKPETESWSGSPGP